MATEYHNIKAKLKWVKVYEPDEYAGSKRWKINVYPFDGKEWEKVTKSGIQVTPKEDEDGKYITLRRDTSKVIKDDFVLFCPPEITGAVEVSYTKPDGERVRSYNKGDFKGDIILKGERKDIGNGSVAIVNFSTYNTKQGVGHRLESLKILDLVGFEKAEEVTEDQKDEAVLEDKPVAAGAPW
jgi:hypothetical protein